MTDPLKTDRLVLRRFEERDVDAITDALQRFEVTSMIPRMPWPYTRADALAFIRDVAAVEDMTFAITLNGALVGSASIQGQLGYWVHPDVWGQGIATETSRALLDAHFDRTDAPVPSGHRLGNGASRAVLRKLGFVDAGRRPLFSNAEAAEVMVQDMTLTRAAWEAHA